MSKITSWDKNFAQSLSSIDHRHQKLVELIHSLGEKVVSSLPMASSEFTNFVGAISEYAASHFRDEEKSELKVLSGGTSLGIEEQAQQLLIFLVRCLTVQILEDGGVPEAGLQALAGAMNKLLQVVSERNRELGERNGKLESEVREKDDALRTVHKQLEEHVVHDELTGLPNRRFAVLNLQQRFFEFHRYDHIFSVLHIDADHFKQVNNALGSSTGDLVLKELALYLRTTTRKSDFVCRLGRDEFLIICPNSSLSESRNLARKIIDSSKPVTNEAGTICWNGSLSIGISEITTATVVPEELLSDAEEALNQAKLKGGREFA